MLIYELYVIHYLCERGSIELMTLDLRQVLAIFAVFLDFEVFCLSALLANEAFPARTIYFDS